MYENINPLDLGDDLVDPEHITELLRHHLEQNGHDHLVELLDRAPPSMVVQYMGMIQQRVNDDGDLRRYLLHSLTHATEDVSETDEFRDLLVTWPLY